MPRLAVGRRGDDGDDDDRRKAQVFFERGQAVANAGEFEYAIEMHLQGLAIDPENTEAHQSLRDISLRRKASGGKDLGMFEKMKLKKRGPDEKQNMLNAEKLLAYDPGNTDHMKRLLQAAQACEFNQTATWISRILRKAEGDPRGPGLF